VVNVQTSCGMQAFSGIGIVAGAPMERPLWVRLEGVLKSMADAAWMRQEGLERGMLDSQASV